MRFIKKLNEPSFLVDFKTEQQKAGIRATYELFRDKKLLNQVLREEQQEICCYCQQRIDHYQKPLNGGAHNEHLVPQESDPGDGSIDLDYNNIYACCITSQGMKSKLTHCGEHKKSSVIIGSIQNPNCEALFMYNLEGEILPSGEYFTWNDYLANYDILPQNLKDIVDEIKILNLNCNYLTSCRKQVVTDLAQWLLNSSPTDIYNKLSQLSEGKNLPAFYSMICFLSAKALTFKI